MDKTNVLMDKTKELTKEIQRINKTLRKGDRIDLLYGNDSIAHYDFIERSIDCKTPLQWLRSCLVFDIALKKRDIDKVS